MINQAAWAPAFEDWVERTLQDKDVPGAAVALAQDGETVYAGGFGLQDREAGLPATKATIFGTGSVSKSFTALAIMQLAEAGKLAVDDFVTRGLPELAFAGGQSASAITIQHLLTHTSGLPPMPSRFYAMLGSMELDEHEQESTAKILADFPPRGPIHSYGEMIAFLGQHQYTVHGVPGERLSYSNEGYSLLGAIIERVSGRRYEEYLDEQILRPIGMIRTSARLERTLAMDNVTAVYARHEGKTYRSPSWFHAPAIIPTGQVRSTVLDLLRYLEMYRNGGRAEGGQVLSAAGIARMTTGHATIDRHRRYGYGWIVNRQHAGLRVVEHSGGHKGVAAHIGFVPDRGISCAVLTNIAGAPSDRIWRRCVGAALGLPLDRPQPPAPRQDLPAEQLAAFAGVYRSGEGTSIEIILENHQLFVEQAGERRAALPAGGDALVTEVEGEEQQLRFLRINSSEFSHVFAGLRIIPRV